MSTFVSLVIPHHDTPKSASFLARLFKSISEQTHTNYEIILAKANGMARAHNMGIARSKGEIIKIIQMDDYFAHPNALKMIVDEFHANAAKSWLISASTHTENGVDTFSAHFPTWHDKIYNGVNTLGSMSTIAFYRDKQLLFEEPLQWIVDCDWYYRMYLKHGTPILSRNVGVVVDVGTHRLSSTLSDELKTNEVSYVLQKYERY